MPSIESLPPTFRERALASLIIWQMRPMTSFWSKDQDKSSLVEYCILEIQPQSNGEMRQEKNGKKMVSEIVPCRYC